MIAGGGGQGRGGGEWFCGCGEDGKLVVCDTLMAGRAIVYEIMMFEANVRDGKYDCIFHIYYMIDN